MKDRMDWFKTEIVFSLSTLFDLFNYVSFYFNLFWPKFDLFPLISTPIRPTSIYFVLFRPNRYISTYFDLFLQISTYTRPILTYSKLFKHISTFFILWRTISTYFQASLKCAPNLTSSSPSPAFFSPHSSAFCLHSLRNFPHMVDYEESSLSLSDRAARELILIINVPSAATYHTIPNTMIIKCKCVN